MTRSCAAFRAGRGLRLLAGLVLLTGAARASGLLPPAHTGPDGWIAAGVTRVPVATFSPDSGAAATLEASEHRLSAATPAWRAGRIGIRLGLDYRYTRYEYQRIAGRNRDLHRLLLPVNLRAGANGWAVAAYVAPGVATSSNVFNEPFARWTADDLVVSAAVEVRRPLGHGWEWLGGLAYDRRFGRPAFYPLAGLYYRDHGSLALRLAFPDSALRYKLNAGNAMTLRIRPAGDRWHVVSDELQADFDYRAVAYRAELTWHTRLSGPFELALALGYETGREHRFTDDTAARLRADAEPHWLFTIGLGSAGAPALP